MTCWEFLVNFKFLFSFSEPLQRELVWGFLFVFSKGKISNKTFLLLEILRFYLCNC